MDWAVRAQDGVTIFLGVMIEATPFLLLGVLVSQGLALALRRDRLGWLARGRVESLVVAAGAGALFPVCECGNVPVARRLVAHGVPVAAATVFLLSAPALNPVVALSTYAAFRDQPTIVLYRLGFTFAIALGVGLLLSLHPEPERLLRAGATPPRDAPMVVPSGPYSLAGGWRGHSPRRGHIGRARQFTRGVVGEFVEMGGVLVVGALLAALTQVLVPRGVLLAIGQGPVISVAVMMGLAVILSICSTVDAFVALAYVGTFSDGALVAFLVFGPMVDIKGVLLMLTIFSARAVALVTALVAEAVFLGGLILNYWSA
jgi:uncharacterized protein